MLTRRMRSSRLTPAALAGLVAEIVLRLRAEGPSRRRSPAQRLGQPLIADRAQSLFDLADGLAGQAKGDRLLPHRNMILLSHHILMLRRESDIFRVNDGLSVKPGRSLPDRGTDSCRYVEAGSGELLLVDGKQVLSLSATSRLFPT